MISAAQVMVTCVSRHFAKIHVYASFLYLIFVYKTAVA